MVGNDLVDHRGDRIVVAHVAGVELVRQSLDGPARARHHRRALVGEDRADPGADATDAARHEDDPVLESEVYVWRVGHCASVPSKCLLRYRPQEVQ